MLDDTSTMLSNSVTNQTSNNIKCHLYDMICNVAKRYIEDVNKGTEKTYLSDFEKKVLLLCEVPENYKGETVRNATT